MPHFIEATIMTVTCKRGDVFIPRIPVLPADLSVPVQAPPVTREVQACHYNQQNRLYTSYAQGSDLPGIFSYFPRMAKPVGRNVVYPQALYN